MQLQLFIQQSGSGKTYFFVELHFSLYASLKIILKLLFSEQVLRDQIY